MGGSKIQGRLFGSTYNKDHRVFGSILGPPIRGEKKVGILYVLGPEMGLTIANAFGSFHKFGVLYRVLE